MSYSIGTASKRLVGHFERTKALRLVATLALAGAAVVATANAQNRAYVVNETSNSVSVIDTSTNAVIATIPVGGSPLNVAVTPDGSRALVVNSNDDTVSVIDTVTNTVIATPGAGFFPFGVAVTPDGTSAYVSSPAGISLAVIDTKSGVVTDGEIDVCPEPTWVAITPDGTTAYVANNYVDGLLMVVDITTNSFEHCFGVSAGSHGQLAITADGSHLYMPNSVDNSVSLIDLSNKTVTATVNVGLAPIGAAISPDGKHLYVTNQVSNTVSVIDTATNNVTATIPVNRCPIGVAFTPDGSRAYVANGLTVTGTACSHSVSVIDTATETMIATINAGNGPFGVAIAPNPIGLNLQAVAYPTPPANGSVLTYAFKVWNKSNQTAQHEILTTETPAGTTFSSIALSGTAGSCTTPDVGSTGPVVCKEGGRMKPGSTWTVRLTVEVAATSGAVLTETASATSDNVGGNAVTIRNTVH